MTEKILLPTQNNFFKGAFKKAPLLSIFYLFFLLTCTNAEELFNILSPKDKSIYNDSFASLSIEEKKEIKKLQIETSDSKVFIFKKSKNSHFCKSIPLVPGLNEIFITAYGIDDSVDRKSLKLFFVSEVHENALEPPFGFKKNYFHNEKHEKKCTKCHNIDASLKAYKKVTIEAKGALTTQIEVLQSPEESSCYTCHESLVSKRYAHAPAVNFMCTTCHTGDSGEYNLLDKGKSKFLNPDPIENICFNCHDRIKQNMSTNKSEHGPAKTGRCNKCHNPHSSNNNFFLRKPIWELCITCHSEKATEKHVINAFVFSSNKEGHPTRGRPDPSRPGRELVCSSCHNPHGSQGPFLLRTTGSSTFSICKRCHKK